MLNKTIFVTFPRSGHHWLMRCLQDYFGDEMRYCEHYTCCNKVPCEKDSNILKNHDFDLDLVVPEGWNVVVQHRTPEASISSWIKAHKPEDRAAFINEKLLFCEKWKAKWVGMHYEVIYEDHLLNPAETLKDLIIHLCGSADVDKVNEIVKNNQEVRE